MVYWDTACPVRKRRCFKCGLQGHLARMCEQHKPTNRTMAVIAPGTSGESDSDASQIWSVTTASTLVPPIQEVFKWNGVEIKMDIDTGSPVCVVPKNVYEAHRQQWPQLQPSKIKLSSYLGKLPILGVLPLQVSYKAATVPCSLVVLGCHGPNLCGRDLLQKLNAEGHSLCHVAALTLPKSTDTTIKEEFADLFTEGLGLVKGPPARLLLRDGTSPKFCKARKVPFALREKVSNELDRLVAEGILSPVSHSEWATPIVPVLKKNGAVRICGDFKVTLNPACDVEHYPLPVIDDMFANLRGGEQFSILDLRDAYNQIPLDEDSRKLAVINTHKGLFRYNRLPFGISSAPAIFQKTIETILQGLTGVQAYLDDVLVSEKNGEHRNLRSVLQRFREHGIKLRLDKCSFHEPSVAYLGHRIDVKGLHPIEKNVEAIRLAPEPRNVSELRSFLGLITFYNKFMPNLSTMLAPLYKLLEKAAKWVWGAKEQTAFKSAKDSLCSAPVLAHFDPDRELLLECDASPYGIGAVLFHRIDGEQRPIGFRSRTLTAAEKNYSQIEREALALVFGVTRFRDYLLGREFVLVTDHQPLLGLLRPDRQTPAMAAARIQRWALLLGAYKYRLQYKPGKQLVNADALSRLPQPLQHEVGAEEDSTECVLLLHQWDEPAIPVKELQASTAADVTLAAVYRYVVDGWPRGASSYERDLSEYHKKRHELSVHRGLLYRGHRVVVPSVVRTRLLKLLHAAHQGVSTMKAVARSKFWWPRLDDDIQRVASSCRSCVQALPMPPAQKPVSWPETLERWSRLHVDFAGPVQGKMLLIVVDSHSKWLEAIPLGQATSRSTVDALRTLFSRFGLPRTVVSDNGPQFVGQEFVEFMHRNGIIHIRTPPYHPQSNGMAERAVRTVKDGLKKAGTTDLHKSLARLLCHYRNAPQESGLSPSEMLLGYKVRTRLDMCFPPREPPASRTTVVDCEQWTIAPGDAVYVRNYGAGDKWTPGKVKSTEGSRVVSVETDNGIVHRHADQVRKRMPDRPSATMSNNDSEGTGAQPSDGTTTLQSAPPDVAADVQPQLRRSTRERKPVERYGF